VNASPINGGTNSTLCPRCQNRGFIDCLECNNSGFTPRRLPAPTRYNHFMQANEMCHKCAGVGGIPCTCESMRASFLNLDMLKQRFEQAMIQAAQFVPLKAFRPSEIEGVPEILRQLRDHYQQVVAKLEREPRHPDDRKIRWCLGTAVVELEHEMAVECISSLNDARRYTSGPRYY